MECVDLSLAPLTNRTPTEVNVLGAKQRISSKYFHEAQGGGWGGQMDYWSDRCYVCLMQNLKRKPAQLANFEANGQIRLD